MGWIIINIIKEKWLYAIILMIGINGLRSKGGIVFKVGDSAGWSDVSNIDYMRWAAARTFHIGDTIVFEYNPQSHSVMQVSLSDFRRCNTMSPVATYTSGNDSIAIRTPGHYFYICGFPGHCQSGQRVDIRVPISP